MLSARIVRSMVAASPRRSVPDQQQAPLQQLTRLLLTLVLLLVLR
jgi:hypothetical protein